MNLRTHFRTLARYNRIANERLFELCAQLDSVEYKKRRQGSFGSIHGLLNHILLGDRIWLARFQGGGAISRPAPHHQPLALIVILILASYKQKIVAVRVQRIFPTFE